MYFRGSYRYLLLALLVMLSACSRGPDEVRAREDLGQRLDQSFQSDLFDIVDFRRTGSAPFRSDGQSGIFIYYDAELSFQKEYNLTDWRGLNLGTLAYVLGATEQGVRGFRTRGNERGDLLKIQGRLAYREDDTGNWTVLSEGELLEPGAADKSRDLTALGPETVLTDVRKMLAAAPAGEAASDGAIVHELRHAVAAIDLQQARQRGAITLGGGPRNGTYQAFSDAFSTFATAQGVAVHSFPSEGSVDNASRIQAGGLDFALVQSDVAQLFHEGWIAKNVLPSRDLRAVASLWPEVVHLVTLESSGIESMADLKGKRLAIGLRGSGTRLNALMLGVAAGFDEDEVPEIREIGRNEAIQALERGDIDALFMTEAVPAPSLQRLAQRRPDARLVPIDINVVQDLADRFFPYYQVVIDARTYPLQSKPYVTLGLASVLMTNQHVADSKVEQVLELLLKGANEMANQFYRAAFVTRETMRLGVEVPLHPAAARFYNGLDSVEAAEQASTAEPSAAADTDLLVEPPVDAEASDVER